MGLRLWHKMSNLTSLVQCSLGSVTTVVKYPTSECRELLFWHFDYHYKTGHWISMFLSFTTVTNRHTDSKNALKCGFSFGKTTLCLSCPKGVSYIAIIQSIWKRDVGSGAAVMRNDSLILAKHELKGLPHVILVSMWDISLLLKAHPISHEWNSSEYITLSCCNAPTCLKLQYYKKTDVLHVITVKFWKFISCLTWKCQGFKSTVSYCIVSMLLICS